MPKVTSAPRAAASAADANAAWKLAIVVDDMIRRQQRHDRVRIVLGQQQRGHRRGRRGVAALRLENDGARRHLELAQLLGDQEAMLLVADDQRRGEAAAGHPPHRLLQHAALGDERQQLLRPQRPRQGPQSRSGAARQDDRDEPIRAHRCSLTALVNDEVLGHVLVEHRQTLFDRVLGRYRCAAPAAMGGS